MSISEKDLIVGHKYLDKLNKSYMYIGKCDKVSIKDTNDKVIYEIFNTYIYLDQNDCSLFYSQEFKCNDIAYLIKHLSRKSPRRFVADIGFSRYQLYIDRSERFVTMQNNGIKIEFVRS